MKLLKNILKNLSNILFTLGLINILIFIMITAGAVKLMLSIGILLIAASIIIELDKKDTKKPTEQKEYLYRYKNRFEDIE